MVKTGGVPWPPYVFFFFFFCLSTILVYCTKGQKGFIPRIRLLRPFPPFPSPCCCRHPPPRWSQPVVLGSIWRHFFKSWSTWRYVFLCFLLFCALDLKGILGVLDGIDIASVFPFFTLLKEQTQSLRVHFDGILQLFWGFCMGFLH